MFFRFLLSKWNWFNSSNCCRSWYIQCLFSNLWKTGHHIVVAILHQGNYIGVKLIGGDILSVLLVICEKQEGLGLTVVLTQFSSLHFGTIIMQWNYINYIFIVSTIWQYSSVFDTYQKYCKNLRNTEDNLLIKKTFQLVVNFEIKNW